MRVSWHVVLFLFFLNIFSQKVHADSLWWPCDSTEIGANLWLVSQHGNRSKESKSKRKLNEKNYGAGLTATCGDYLAFQYDQLKNSQFGKNDHTWGNAQLRKS
jgi:hypothetical protein